jgi:hypothetical protein
LGFRIIEDDVEEKRKNQKGFHDKNLNSERKYEYLIGDS